MTFSTFTKLFNYHHLPFPEFFQHFSHSVPIRHNSPFLFPLAPGTFYSISGL